MGQKHCQSCDMPLSKDPKGGGTNADGSLSDKYCSMCYVDGVFAVDIRDVKEYQRWVISMMVDDGWWRPMAWLMTRRIPKLERWRNG